ncbi:SDR family NAD(P)-dependent oxidoreductase [Kibdelosporangium lantanae]|uniref:SDR family NAD(P)-dependent oxidoreductase n=1 Tax=Kibdelosporangium lantanae TaxID=1497396 RepID=A0ABW3MGY2_9PSEU
MDIALVTGGNRGIGYEIAARLVAVGMTVVLTARDPARLADAARRLPVCPVVLDVTDPSTISAAAEYVDERFGRLDVLVNNAGVAGDVRAQAPSAADLSVVRAVFETNYFGVVGVTNAMVPLLRRSGCARIVNVSSGLGSLTRMSDPADYFVGLPPSAAYAPAKTALNAVTVQYAKELPDFRVNAVDPGPCDTDFTRGRYPVVRTAAQGAAVAVRYATIDSSGPTGGYFNETGPVPW